MNSQSFSQVSSDRLAFQRSLPSTPQHQRVVLVWLLRITARPASVRARTTASYTCSGVFPSSSGLAVTASAVTGRVSWIISLEKGSRTLLIPISRKLATISVIGARSRPSGTRWEFSPAWWLASLSALPLPFQVPLAPCQLPERSLKRSPFASTIQRPRVLSGGVQSAGAAAVSSAGAGGRAAAGTGTERAIRTRTDAIFGTQEPRTAAAPSTKVTS